MINISYFILKYVDILLLKKTFYCWYNKQVNNPYTLVILSILYFIVG